MNISLFKCFFTLICVSGMSINPKTLGKNNPGGVLWFLYVRNDAFSHNGRLIGFHLPMAMYVVSLHGLGPPPLDPPTG